MEKFWELLERSVIVQSLLALACLGAIVYLSVTGQDVPEVLVNGFLLILGFYFGSKVQTEASRIAGKRG